MINSPGLELSSMTEGQKRRFWAKVHISDPDTCWEWLGSKKLVNPYGVFHWKGKHRAAHRLAYALTYGAIPANLCVLHSCDNPKCVNPGHLRLGTHEDNMADIVLRERWDGHHGACNGRAKLDEATVHDLFRLYNTGCYTMEQLGEKVGVNLSQVRRILRGEQWGHLGLRLTFERRVEGLAAINAAKTHCSNGHPFSGDNLVIKDGRRRCRACIRLAWQRANQRRSAVRAAQQ